MKEKIVASIMITALFVALFGITFKIPIVPVVFSDQSVSRREVWKLLNVTVPSTKHVDIDFEVTPKSGVYIACSPNVTQYFEDESAQAEYSDWMEWLNRSTADHHWESMDWYVSDGSLTPITYDDIQQWGVMYMDTANVPYMTFMGNTYMADSNLTQYSNEDDPDIISSANWIGNTIKIINDLLINYSIRDKVNIAFKIVLTEPGVYTFDISATGGVELSETSWVMGGAKTLIVPGDYLTVHEAVEAADSGYTINVQNGTYIENVVLPQGKSLTLLGAQANIDPRGGREGPETILDGGVYSSGNYGFTIRDTVGEDVVTINGFTIKDYDYGIFGHYDDAFIQNLTVSYNMFENNGDPDLPSSSGWHHDGGAMRIDNVDHSTFSHNVIRECERGIRLDDNSKGGSDYNTVEYNLIHDLQQYGIGLYDYANYNTLTSNTIYNCADRGVQLWKTNTGNKIVNNTIYNCCNDGILLHDSVNAEIKHNDVHNCAFTDQTWSGDYTDNGGPDSGFGYQPVHAGIAILGASFNITISENDVYKNGVLKEVSFASSAGGSAMWMEGTNHLGELTQDLINLTAPSAGDWDFAEIHILPPLGMTLDDFVSVSWWVYTASGYPSDLELGLDTDGNGIVDQALIAEFAYQPWDGTGYPSNYQIPPNPWPGKPYKRYDGGTGSAQANCYWPTYNTWVQTFDAPSSPWTGSAYDDSAKGAVTVVDDRTIFWNPFMGSATPVTGAGGYFATLEDWKRGGVADVDNTQPASPVDGSAVITDILMVAYDSIDATEVLIDEIKLNGIKVTSGLGWSDWNGLTEHATSDGIWIDSASSAVIVHNNIYGNREYGVENTNTGVILESVFNWWGDEKGPGNEIGSTGDDVSDNVDYKPWLIKPYAPGQVVPVAVVYVDPDFVNLTAPALGTTFNVDVNIVNVTMMYAFQLTLEWDDTLLNGIDANPIVPTPWGSDVWINQTWGEKNYSLAIAPTNPGAPSFTGDATLVSVTFQTIRDPIFPSEPKLTCDLALEAVRIGDVSGILPHYIPHIAYSGNYSCYSTMPKLLVMPPNPTASKVPTEFAVNITVTNVVKLQSFEFNLTYNQTMLKAIKVGNPPYIPVPHQDPGEGSIYIRVGPSEGNISPTVSGSMTLVTITFKVMRGFAWSTEATSIDCTLGFDPMTHTLNLSAPIDHEVVNGIYSYVPLQGDVYFTDGLVDIYDLLFVANKFGTKPGGPPYDPGDLNCDGEIDILDIILVARNFGAEV